ncbi:MAG: glycoside hydrolase family 18 protein [Cyclobacteriaceae bacterium]|nr:glycoside hydrolase family 18 protein [Cyclobacteriaceae bacterium]
MIRLPYLPAVAGLFLVLFTSCGKNLKKEVPYPDKPYIIAYVHGYEDNWGENDEKAKMITHINYAFANVIDGKVVEGKPEDKKNLARLNALKKTNPKLKVLISAGGWGWSGGFSDAVVDEQAREVFAASAIDFMLRHKLDGVDLDWEYPGQTGNNNTFRAEDKQNFTLILKRIREKLDSLEAISGVHYLQTIATGASQGYLDHTEMDIAHEYLDFINIMTYDFKGGWNPYTGHHSNLKVSEFDTLTNPMSAEVATAQHVAAGIPVDKLVLGFAFYGRGWQGVPAKNNGLYQLAGGKAFGIPYKKLKDSLINKNGFVRYWDESASAPYLYHADSAVFITYEDPQSYAARCAFIKEKGMAGAMFWQFNQDDGDLLGALSENLPQPIKNEN